MWYTMNIVLGFAKQRQEDCEFKANLSWNTETLVQKSQETVLEARSRMFT